jgi:hypothetical protein
MKLHSADLKLFTSFVGVENEFSLLPLQISWFCFIVCFAESRSYKFDKGKKM